MKDDFLEILVWKSSRFFPYRHFWILYIILTRVIFCIFISEFSYFQNQLLEARPCFVKQTLSSLWQCLIVSLNSTQLLPSYLYFEGAISFYTVFKIQLYMVPKLRHLEFIKNKNNMPAQKGKMFFISHINICLNYLLCFAYRDSLVNTYKILCGNVAQLADFFLSMHKIPEFDLQHNIKLSVPAHISTTVTCLVEARRPEV